MGLVEASEGEMERGWRYGMEKARVRKSKPEAMENIYNENGKRKESRGIEGNKRGNDKVGKTKLKVDGRDPISMENGIIVTSTTQTTRWNPVTLQLVQESGKGSSVVELGEINDKMWTTRSDRKGVKEPGT